MNYKRIAHTAFKVRNMEESLKFYVDGLGFKRKFELEDEIERPWIVYLEIAPLQYIELFYDFDNCDKGVQDYEHIGYLHLSIEVDDIKKLKEELIKNGVRIQQDIALGIDNTYQMWVEDPDGNPIEFMEYTKKSLQLQ